MLILWKEAMISFTRPLRLGMDIGGVFSNETCNEVRAGENPEHMPWKEKEEKILRDYSAKN